MADDHRPHRSAGDNRSGTAAWSVPDDEARFLAENDCMNEVDPFLTNCRLADGRLVDIGISGGKIAVVGEDAAALSNSAPSPISSRRTAFDGWVRGGLR